MVLLLLACSVVVMIRRGRKKVALLHKHTALVSSGSKLGVTINMKELMTPGSGVAGVLSGTGTCGTGGGTPVSGGSGGLTRVLGSATCSKGKVGVGTPNHGAAKVAVACSGSKRAGSLYGGGGGHEESEDSENSSVYHEPYKLLASAPAAAHQDYGCLLTSSKSGGQYTGK